MVKKIDYKTKVHGRIESKLSGLRKEIASKPRYDLIYRPILTRLAELYGRGAMKYGERNWELANSLDDINTFKGSLFRHLVQYLDGETDEDHAAAIIWNVSAIEFVKDKMRKKYGK